MSRPVNRHYLFILITLLIFCVSISDQSIADDVPVTKLSQNVGTPTIKFLYCYSCGYKNMFDQYSNIINQKYPEILVDGANYDPPGLNMFIARAIGWIKMAIILCILSNINIFEYFNQARPSWWIWCVENKLYACMMLFFLSNILEGQLIQSGAFEISLNDIPVWSKLETGRIPQPTELFQIIDSHMQFDNKIELNNFAK
ncbi:thioredoxin reductase-like selenoprotein T homolog CG3887 [Diorhabda carinulata]|uniref:thioredoxin reductase-like selenoprotein T homolog CG3887 n=1 Tax=Diorhabda sublineata TaxID=1163346 RepID=UPI0024E11E49|nr:thioredoxin reductase-like selenoprotein T homolog CG3887 [Diorhabda sublineata]XP_057651269.1 thioredoxin reductase-like selenoprotein T homolog CG3887 [Diorhabda carinulata]